MDLGTLRDLAVGKVLGPTSPERALEVNAKFVDALINEALHIIERAALWKFSEKEAALVLPAGSRTLPAPADLAVPLMAKNETQEYDLLFHDERQAFLPPGPDSGGQVTTYAIYGTELRFSPAPRAATDITLRYYKTWPDLVLDADEPIFPATWHDILSSYASAKLALRLTPTGGRFLPKSEAEPHREAWESGLLSMLSSELTMTTLDIVESHNLTHSVFLGQGVDW